MDEPCQSLSRHSEGPFYALALFMNGLENDEVVQRALQHIKSVLDRFQGRMKGFVQVQ
jgi:hypothetical protein